MTRLAVPKTYKLYIGGAFPRSESGRTYEVVSAKGAFLANAAKASRKDARDAVVAARGAVGGWSGATAYNRGQVLYRIAELLEGRRAQFVAEIVDAEGVSAAVATAQVDNAIDRWVWYAGWTDKYAQVAGNANPVAGPYFNISVPEPTGVVAIIAPAGLVAARAGVRGRPRARRREHGRRRGQREAAAVGDQPGGGPRDERRAQGRRQRAHGLPRGDRAVAGRHQDVNALDLVGAGDLDWIDLQIAAADTLKRVLPPENGPDAAAPSLDRITAFVETKTVWHTKGLI